MIARPSRHIALTTIAGAVLMAGITGAAALPQGVAHAATAARHAQALIGVAQRPPFGRILVNGHGFALYYWAQEKKGIVRCTGQCAKVWPPLLVSAHTMVPMHLAGVMGTFGVVMRPDGGHQLAFNHHPLYTFQGDKTPSQILCDGVNGWHVYRLGH